MALEQTENEGLGGRLQAGREDVIKIVPHIAAQQRLLPPDRGTETAELNDCA